MPYSPRRRMEDQRVGGSETALFWVARGLARLGWDVTILNHCGADSGLYEGVRYLDLTQHWTRWRAESRANKPDVLVLFRRMLDVLSDIPSKVRVFWAHDHQGVYASDPPGFSRSLAIGWRRMTGPQFHRRVDRVFVVSNFMADLFRWLFRTPAEKLVVMPNGIDGSLFKDPAVHHPLKFMHSSVPDRGLTQLLLEIFPVIRKTYPGSELHLFSYQPLDGYKKYASASVQFHGWVKKEELIRALEESWLMLYPANFEEMGAISVLESMAAGTPAITSTLGVLAELAGNGERGVAVAGRPGSRDFAQRFVGATLDLLGSPERLERMRAAARHYVLAIHPWDRVVHKWDETLRDLAGTRGQE